MRYLNADTIIFVDKNSISYQIKDNLPIGIYTTAIVETLNNDTMIDELISREEYYGDNSESLSYAVVDNNIVEMMENEFNLSNIKSLKIPYIEG